MKIELVASGDKWVGYGIRSFNSVVKEIIDSTNYELIMSIYVITDLEILDLIEQKLIEGIYVEIYIDNPINYYSIKGYERALELKKYSNFLFTEISSQVLHAKYLVSDNKIVLLGSANISFKGMTTNYELGVTFNNIDLARKIIELTRRLSK